MRKKTFRQIFIPLVLSSTAFIGLFFGGIQPAYAAPPRCFLSSALPEVQEVQCNPAAAQLLSNITLQDDQCYTIAGGSSDFANGGYTRQPSCDQFLNVTVPQLQQHADTVAQIACENGEEGVQLSTGECIPADENNDNLAENPIIIYLGRIINFLLAGVGVAVVLVIILAGYQYMTSQGNPQGINEAKDKIWKAVISLIAYIFAWAIINWLVPGGFF